MKNTELLQVVRDEGDEFETANSFRYMKLSQSATTFFQEVLITGELFHDFTRDL